MENLGPSLDLNTVNLLCTVVTKPPANMPSTSQPNVMQPAQNYTAMRETTVPADQVFSAQGQISATRTISQASNGFELARLATPYANGINVGSIANFSEVNQMVALGKQPFITAGLPNINSFSDPLHFIPQPSLNTCGPPSFIEKNERLPSFSTIVASAASSSPVIGLQRQFTNVTPSTVEQSLALPSPVSSSSPIQSNACTNIVAATNIPLSSIPTNADNNFQTISPSFTNYYAGRSSQQQQQLLQQQAQPQQQQQQHQSVIQHLSTGTTKAVSSSQPAACTSQVVAAATTLVLSSISPLHHSHPKARLSLPLSSSSSCSEENCDNAKCKSLSKMDNVGEICEQNLSKHKSRLSPERQQEQQQQFVNTVHLTPQQIASGGLHKIIEKTCKQNQKIIISDQVTSLKIAKKNKKDLLIIAPTQVNPMAKPDMVPIYFSPLQNSVQTSGVSPVITTAHPPPQMMSAANKSKGVQFFVMGKLEGKSTSEGLSFHDPPRDSDSGMADLPISFEKHPVDGIVVKRMAPVPLRLDLLGRESLDFMPQDSDKVKQEPPEKRLESSEPQQVDLQLLLQQHQQQQQQPQQQQQQIHVQTTIQQAEAHEQTLQPSPPHIQPCVQPFQTISPEQLHMPQFRQIQSQHLLQHLQTTQGQPQTQFQAVITADGQAQIADNLGQFTAQQFQHVTQQPELQLQQPEQQQLTPEHQQQQQQQQQVVGTQLTIQQQPLLSPLLSPALPSETLAANARKSPRQKQSGMVYMESAAKAVVTTTVGDNATFVTVSIMNNRKAPVGPHAKTDTTDSDLALGSLTSVTLASSGLMEAGSSAVKRKLSDCSDSEGSECSDSESGGDKCDLSQDENQDGNLYTLKPPFVLPPLSSLSSPAPQGADGIEMKDIKEEFDRTEVEIRIDDSQCIVYGEQKRWQCCMCPKSYTTKHNLVTHILDHQGIKPHLCMICHKYFKQLSHLNTHMLTHENIKPHVCQICNKGFTQISHLKRHKAVHLDSKPFLCDICNRGFAYPSELRVHKEKHVPGRDKCHDCGEDFTSQRLLRQHQATHEHREDLTCKMCTKLFRYPSQLKDHMITHSGTRPHICPECGMDFMKEHHLKAHQFTHTGLQPFVCQICGRSFNQKANMQRHQLIHNAERAFRCETCCKTFTQPQTLKAHMVVHAESKPYRCNLCSKEFGRLHNLQGHMHMHNNSKPFVCFCGSSFTLKGNLNRHKKVKHGLNETTESMEEDAVNFLSERCRDSEGDKDSSVDKFGEKDDAQGNKKHRKPGSRRTTSKHGAVTGKSGRKGKNGKGGGGGGGGGGMKTDVEAAAASIIMGNSIGSNDNGKGIAEEEEEEEEDDDEEEEEDDDEVEEDEEEEEEEEEDEREPEGEEELEEDEGDVGEQMLEEKEIEEEEEEEEELEGEEEEEMVAEGVMERMVGAVEGEGENEEDEGEEEEREGGEEEAEEEVRKDDKDANVVTKYFKNHCDTKKVETVAPNTDLRPKDVSSQDAFSFTSTDSESVDNSSAYSESEKDDGAKEDQTDADWLPPNRKRRRRRGGGGKVTNTYLKYKDG